MSSIAVIALVVALLLLILVAGLRWYVAARATVVEHDAQPFRSHAEASRNRDHGRP